MNESRLSWHRAFEVVNQLRGVAIGCPDRFDIESLAVAHYDAIFRFCARRVGVDRASDAAQETFLTAQKALGKFRGESTVSTWLFGIAHNECRRLIRKNRLETSGLGCELLAASTPTEHSLVNQETLRKALDDLSPDHREVVILHEIEGLTYDEAAVVLGVPSGTVKSRLHHAFIALRKSIYGEAK